MSAFASPDVPAGLEMLLLLLLLLLLLHKPTIFHNSSLLPPLH